MALITSPRTALAVCGPPAPGPDMVISVNSSDSTVTALNGPVHRRQRVARIQEGRVDANREPVVDPLRRPDQLELQPQIVRVLQVVGLDVLDALVAHLVEMHRRVEGEPGQDGHLGRGVASVDVLCRIGLGVAETLGLRQRLGEIRSRFGPSR